MRRKQEKTREGRIEQEKTEVELRRGGTEEGGIETGMHRANRRATERKQERTLFNLHSSGCEI